MRLFKLFIVITLLVLTSCTNKNEQSPMSKSETLPTITVRHDFPDTLVVGTIYSPASFFILKGDTLGYDYERICAFARENKMGIKFHVATSMKELIAYVENNKVHVAAYEIPITAEYKQHVIHCGAQNETYQVLVQKEGKDTINNVTQLIDKDVYVIHGSNYEARLRNLDSEIGGGIKIHAIDNDSLISEDLIDMHQHKPESGIPSTLVMGCGQRLEMACRHHQLLVKERQHNCTCPRNQAAIFRDEQAPHRLNEGAERLAH